MYRDLAYCLLVAALFAACDAGTGDLIGPTPTTPTPTTSGIGSGPGCYRASYGGFGASAFQCGLLSFKWECLVRRRISGGSAVSG